MIPLIEPPITDWYCPACGKTERTAAKNYVHGERASRFHTCPKLRFLSAPMLPKETKAKVEVREREDYVNGDLVQLDPERGRPVMSMVTTRDKGTDTRVYAPTATMSGD